MRRRDDFSACSWTLKLITKMSQFFFFGYKVHFLGISFVSVSLRYQLIRGYYDSNMWVSFRYQLWHFWDVLSCSVSLRCQLVRLYDFSNWRRKDVSNSSIAFTYQLRRRDDVSAWSAMSRHIWDLHETSLFIRLIQPLFFLSLFLPPRMFNMKEKKLNTNGNNGKKRLVMKMTFRLYKMFKK